MEVKTTRYSSKVAVGQIKLAFVATLTATSDEDIFYPERCKQACVCLTELNNRLVRTATVICSTEPELERSIALLTGEKWEARKQRPR